MDKFVGREILFRAQRVGSNDIVEGYYFKAKMHWHKYGIHEDWISVRALQNGGWCNLIEKYPIRPETLCEFTNHIDIDGEKIFEGDVVVGDCAFRPNINGEPFVVCREDDGFVLKDHTGIGWRFKQILHIKRLENIDRIVIPKKIKTKALP